VKCQVEAIDAAPKASRSAGSGPTLTVLVIWFDAKLGYASDGHRYSVTQELAGERSQLTVRFFPNSEATPKCVSSWRRQAEQTAALEKAEHAAAVAALRREVDRLSTSWRTCEPSSANPSIYYHI